MNELKIINHNGVEVVDSREVAQMVEKPHNDLMKSIRNYCEALTAGDFSLSDFFIESRYKDPTGRTLPCYLITKKGCDMVANKMTGETVKKVRTILSRPPLYAFCTKAKQKRRFLTFEDTSPKLGRCAQF